MVLSTRVSKVALVPNLEPCLIYQTGQLQWKRNIRKINALNVQRHPVKFTSSTVQSKNEYHQEVITNLWQKNSFSQESPVIDKNVFLGDPFLQRCLFRLIPDRQCHTNVQNDLIRFGQRVSSEISNIGRKCELEPPYLKNSTDAWGRHNHNRLITCEAWKSQKRVCAEEGLVAIPYRNKNKFSRIHQVAKIYMYSPVSGLYWCPLAMTDGAAQAISRIKSRSPELEDALERLTSYEANKFWTSGQWMTEARGGSDVARSTESYAIGPIADGTYRLHGYKWFASAADSDVALALARILDENQMPLPGTQGISMFLIKNQSTTENANNGIDILKLKNKLGTRQLPTAELMMTDTKGTLISQEGRGIASIASMFTISRMHNIIASVGIQRHMSNLARDYATKRFAFGKQILQHPLHIATLSRLETDARGCTALMLDLARQIGEEEEGCISNDDKLLLRLMMPVAKAFTAKLAVTNISEGIESFGGQGYIEDTGIPGMLRDSQVLPIWEGTTNIMVLDMQRALDKSNGESLEVLHRRIMKVTEKGVHHANEYIRAASRKLLNNTKSFKTLFSEEYHEMESHTNGQKTKIHRENHMISRDVMFSLANLYIGSLLLEHVLFYNGAIKTDVITLMNWLIQKESSLAKCCDKSIITGEQETGIYNNILYEGYLESK